MNMHKNTRLTPHHRQAIWLAYTQEKESVTSPGTPLPSQPRHHYRALKAARGRLLKPQTSTNNRFKQAKYGMKTPGQGRNAAFRKNSKGRPNATINPTPESWYISIPNGMPLLKGQKATDKRNYLFVAIDDFSRELYAAILPDKTADSAAKVSDWTPD